MVIIEEIQEEQQKKRGWIKGVPRSKLTLEEQHQRKLISTSNGYYARHEENKEKKRLYYKENADRINARRKELKEIKKRSC